ncbi:MAG: transcriptional repressor [Clostridium sp.]|nr:transcriptional repressor [Prevotella sp.]MCM1428666.1 transcriptional repressor [Clostridium sp.]MCM1475795.1 transcriptional repressor [Muribaculaceae bacterium]
MSEERENTSAASILARHMEERGMRKTTERFAILGRAMTMNGHFSGDELHSRMEREGFHVSRSTVYSTLTLLCECGLIRRHLLTARRAGYEVAQTNHCHLVCIHCGKVEEAEGNDWPRVESFGGTSFRPSYYSMTVYGLCSDCAEKIGKLEMRN